MQQWILIFIGGGLGSLCRYGIGRLIPASPHFFYGTFAANVLSSLLLGVLIGLSIKQIVNAELKLFLMVGFCGGFSTFSTFSSETFQLFQSGQLLSALGYIFWSVLVCVICIYIGMRLAGS